MHLPKPAVQPSLVLARRLGLAIGLVAFVTLVAYLGRDDYRDSAGGAVGLVDALYYATVSITTTGYGDIIPVTDAARLLTALLVTPARIVFLILLVGTTLEVLAAGTRTALRTQRWRRRSLDGHTIICGYGTKGRRAVATLLGRGVARERIIVIDNRPDAVEEANRDDLVAIAGDAARASVLSSAGIERAAAIVVAADRDDTAVLVTLTARELNPGAPIIAAVREDENRHFLHQSGASSVITTSGAAGRLLGLAALEPNVVELLEDLLTVGAGLEIIQREVPPDAVGGPLSALPSEAPVLAVVRDGELVRFDDPRTSALRAGDRLVCLCSNAG